jgi:RHS repeat-associated protein
MGMQRRIQFSGSETPRSRKNYPRFILVGSGMQYYAYDYVGNLTSVTYHVSHLLSFGYNAMNWLTNMSDGIGTTAFGYTPAGQLASENGPWTSDTMSYTYTNRLRTVLDLQQPDTSDWIEDYGYDSSERMATITSPAGTFTYSYNPGLAGRVSASSLIAKIALPNGAWITNTYDNNGRMLGTWLTNISSNLDSTVYAYNVGNLRTTAVRTGENTASYAYDAINEITADTASEASGGTTRYNEQLHYAFDAAGNLAYRTNNTLVENFQVNSVNELTANTNGGTLTVIGTTTTSAATNVTVNTTTAARIYGDATFAATNMPLTTTYTAVAADSYGRHSTSTVTVGLVTNNASYQYDGNGNLTNDGLRSFAYDDENQLIQVWVANQWFSQFAYDGKMRRRIRQEFTWQSSGWVQTNEVYYLYDKNLVVQERNINNLPTTTYTRGKDISGSLQRGGGISGLLSMTLNTASGPLSSNSMYYHSDGNGNVTMLINPSQFIVARYLYDAFGNVLSAAGSMAQQNVYRFSSKEAHLNSGLLYYGYRYYDPNLQRWINTDPLGELGGINLYGYVRNNPIGKSDRYGLCDDDNLAIRLIKLHFTMKDILEAAEIFLTVENPVIELVELVGQSQLTDYGVKVGEATIGAAQVGITYAINGYIQSASDNQNDTNPDLPSSYATQAATEANGGMSDPYEFLYSP